MGGLVLRRGLPIYPREPGPTPQAANLTSDAAKTSSPLAKVLDFCFFPSFTWRGGAWFALGMPNQRDAGKRQRIRDERWSKVFFKKPGPSNVPQKLVASKLRGFIPYLYG